MRPITECQEQTLLFIETFIQNEHYPPSIRDIAANFQISPKAAFDRIFGLTQKGYIKTQYGKARTITLAKKQVGKA